MDMQLHREIAKLDDEEMFSRGFQTDRLRDFVLGMGGDGSGERGYAGNRLQAEMWFMNRKNVYVAMKWMIFVHQVISASDNLTVLEMVDGMLGNMPNPHTQQKYQAYLLTKLFSPYLQYLKRLISKKINRTYLNSANQQQFKCQAYSEYNFINFTISEFSKPIREFTPYLQHDFPHLNRYVELIYHDLEPLYSHLLHAFERNQLENITFIEIQKMGAKIMIFTACRQGKKTSEASTDHSNSSKDHQPLPINPITPFYSLESSNLSLTFPLKN